MYKSQDLVALADEYIEEADCAYENKQIIQAIHLAQNALHLYKEAGALEKYAYCLNSIGVFYSTVGNENGAVDTYLEGLDLCEKQHLEQYYSLFYNNIGSGFQDLREYNKAIEYFLKTEECLKHEKAKKEERYQLRLLITYMNLCDAYRAQGEYEKAKEYLSKAEQYFEIPEAQTYKDSFLVSKCHLLWEAGNEEFVRLHLEEIVSGIIANVNTSDYVQDLKSACELLEKMKEYDSWKRILEAADTYIGSQHSIFFRMMLMEFWMDYYQSISDEESFTKACVEHAKLIRKQREVEDKERASALEMKIELAEKEKQRRIAEEESHTDVLTKVNNRHKLQHDMEDMLEDCLAKKQMLGVGLLDIDCFKEINDTYGHLFGDECLTKVAEVISQAVEGKGYAYRYGGDEFVLLFEDGCCSLMEETANQIQLQIEKLALPNEKSKVIPYLTLSQGYASFYPKMDETGRKLLDHADKALYYVKEHGRNGIRIISEE